MPLQIHPGGSLQAAATTVGGCRTGKHTAHPLEADWSGSPVALTKGGHNRSLQMTGKNIQMAPLTLSIHVMRDEEEGIARLLAKCLMPEWSSNCSVLSEMAMGIHCYKLLQNGSTHAIKSLFWSNSQTLFLFEV